MKTLEDLIFENGTIKYGFNVDEITAYFTVRIGDGFFKEEKFIFDDYTLLFENDGRLFWIFIYLVHLIYYSDKEKEYDKEELKIINNCEEIINDFLHKNHLLSKDFSLEDIIRLRIYLDEYKLSHFKIVINSNRLDLAKKVNEAFKNNENKE